MIPELIERLLGGESADPKALEDALHRIMMGEVPQLQTAGLLVALRVREPDAPTLAACARAMRAHRLAVQTEVHPALERIQALTRRISRPCSRTCCGAGKSTPSSRSVTKSSSINKSSLTSAAKRG